MMTDVDYLRLGGTTFYPPSLITGVSDVVIDPISSFVEEQEQNFQSILRKNQLGNRYDHLGSFRTSPQTGLERYKNAIVTGLFYYDKEPEHNIKYKQDLIFFFLEEGMYEFVIDKAWLKPFPELEPFHPKLILWSSTFRGNISSGQYGINDKNKHYDHWYKNLHDLPPEIQDIARLKGCV